MNILVTGATGYIGGRLIPRLLQKGYFVRCLARRPENLSDRPWNTSEHSVEVVAGDVLDPSSLKLAFVGVEVAYYLVHSMSAGEKGFEDRDRRAAKNFGEAARQAGVRKIIYLGGLGEERGLGEELSPHLQSRHEVGEILRQSGVPVTEFRAAIIVGSGSISFEMIRYLTERLPLMICPKWVLSRCQPISIRDVLAYLLAAVEVSASDNKILEIGGRDVLTYADMMRRYAKVRGLHRLLIRVPVLTPRLSSYWVDLITPIPAALARPLIEGLKNDVVCRRREALEIFPFQPMGYEEALRLALDRSSQGSIETMWSGAESSRSSRLAASIQIREGMIVETRQAEVHAAAEKVFEVVASLGGARGWLYANWMWTLRGLFDRILGGVGMRRGRRDSRSLQVGDAVDFWRVEAIEKNRLLRLRAEMKLPGRAWLQFQLASEQGVSRLTQSAFFEPKGLGGLLYWYLLYPMHRMIFSGLCRRIRRLSEGMS
ncbi:MAG TPA: DUF2867 domain-containing protein [Deltaproteobacteria bacterium]|nr:DUF2867 domain-containing protein [Deltaproteobacteria bacterium]